MTSTCPSCGHEEYRKPTNAEIRWVSPETVIYAQCPECEAREEAFEVMGIAEEERQ